MHHFIYVGYTKNLLEYIRINYNIYQILFNITTYENALGVVIFIIDRVRSAIGFNIVINKKNERNGIMRNEANFNGFCLSGRLICLTGHRGFVGMSESSLRTAAQMSKSFHDSRDMTTAAQADIRHANGGGIYKI